MTTSPNPDRIEDDEESESERLARNWTELLQELRVTQTGTQILTGFLLTIVFQQRFTELNDYQLAIYLALVILAALTTALGLTPVSLHRSLFHQRAKERLVRTGNRILKITLAGVAIVLAGTILLIFDVVAGTAIGLIAGATSLVVIFATWFLLPKTMRRARRVG
jgi:hypothetical protein